jgi:virulence-associated protein VapD
MEELNKYHWAFNFDLSEVLLTQNYPRSRSYAWTEVRKFMESNSFYHEQYSGYCTAERMNRIQIQETTRNLAQQLPWFFRCVHAADFTIKDDGFKALEYVEDNIFTDSVGNVPQVIDDIVDNLDPELDPFSSLPSVSAVEPEDSMQHDDDRVLSTAYVQRFTR